MIATLALISLLLPQEPGISVAWQRSMLTDRGTDALRDTYEVVLARSPDPTTTSWFAGYAELVIAEIKVDEADSPAAGLAYGRAIDLFERSVADRPDFADTANHYLALALAGRAAAALDAGDLNRAAADLITALPVRPETLEAEDGLQRQPIDILVRVYRALREEGNAELARSLAESLEQAAPYLRNRLGR